MLFTDQRLNLLQKVQLFTEEVLRPEALRLDAKAKFPSEIYAECASRGLLGIGLPEEFGGTGEDHIVAILASEIIARVSPSFAMSFGMCADVALPIIVYGEESVRQSYIPGIIDGSVIPCVCISEANAGSDAAALQTTARKFGAAYVLNGTKNWVTSASVGDVFVVLAKTDPEGGNKGVSAFVVDRQLPGIRISPDHDLLGFRASPTASVILEDVHVPERCLLGDEGEGFRITMKMLDLYRLNAAGIGLGIATAALQHSTSFARGRQIFGRPLIEHEGISFEIGSAAAELAAARALWEQALVLMGAPRTKLGSAYAAMSKLVCADLGMKLSTQAVQVHGAAGLDASSPPAMLMRDAKVVQMIDGTSEVQKLLISRFLAKEDLPQWRGDRVHPHLEGRKQ
ncbi:acyl-CoA dehydrogenase family protein [Mesorhizobium amorphae]|uniref:acyl-CoA dehydrogenase family protein n=1 Tax=Mesorhizobium amorphae TaxID=71433 RepID=UPI00177DE325|nr:acyl-CoA dehydrogenase family protein [Mesorhizobium amorphae]